MFKRLHAAEAARPGVPAIQYAQGASTQVFAYLDLQKRLLEEPGKAKLPVFQGRIELENVSFTYDPESIPVRKDISLAATKAK